jgi:hypothetical protein
VEPGASRTAVGAGRVAEVVAFTERTRGVGGALCSGLGGRNRRESVK